MAEIFLHFCLMGIFRIPKNWVPADSSDYKFGKFRLYCFTSTTYWYGISFRIGIKLHDYFYVTYKKHKGQKSAIQEARHCLRTIVCNLQTTVRNLQTTARNLKNKLGIASAVSKKTDKKWNSFTFCGTVFVEQRPKNVEQLPISGTGPVSRSHFYKLWNRGPNWKF